MYYAGIGSRETPSSVLEQMITLAYGWAKKGFVLRSGGARGADKAWEAGVDLANAEGLIMGAKEIYTVENTNILPEAVAIAKKFHPAWHACSPYAKRLLSRNVHILLGKTLKEPVTFAGYWRDRALKKGGTLHALKVCEFYNIPTLYVDGEIL